MKSSELFAQEPCSRCDGSGNYSYCTMYGTRCFKCQGTGLQWVRKDKPAATAYLWAYDHAKKASNFNAVVGDIVGIDGFYRLLVAVEHIPGTAERNTGCSTSYRDGVEHQHYYGQTSYTYCVDGKPTTVCVSQYAQHNRKATLDTILHTLATYAAGGFDKDHKPNKAAAKALKTAKAWLAAQVQA